jgi:predicted dinucleotide-binding enzyme
MKTTELTHHTAIASDDEAAKAIVAKLAENSGGRPFDLGSCKTPV